MSDWKEKGYFNPYDLLPGEEKGKQYEALSSKLKNTIFAACEWEAIRRNKGFIDDVEKIINRIHELKCDSSEGNLIDKNFYHLGYPEGQRLFLNSSIANKVSRTIMEAKLHDKDNYHVDEKKVNPINHGSEGRLLGKCWPKTPKEFRTAILSSIFSDPKIDHDFVERTCDGIEWQYDLDYPDQVDSALRDLVMRLRTVRNRIILLPQTPCFNRKQQDDLLEEIRKHMDGQKCGHLAPKNTSIHKLTRDNWEAFLVDEKYENRTVYFREAMLLYTFNPKEWKSMIRDFGGNPRSMTPEEGSEFLEQERGENILSTKDPKRKTPKRVSGYAYHIKCVKSHIASLYSLT